MNWAAAKRPFKAVEDRTFQAANAGRRSESRLPVVQQTVKLGGQLCIAELFEVAAKINSKPHGFP